MLPEYFEFHLPTKVVYGVGILDQLAGEIAHFGPRRAILVTDKVLLQTGPAKTAKKAFSKTNVKIVCTYSNVPPNSTLQTVKNCAALAKRHRCDCFVIVGGGSVIDTAKVANLMVTKGGRIEDRMGAYLLDKNERLLPAICIPTTAGTGSEVTRVAVIADPKKDVKMPFTEAQFLPDLAVIDPRMTASMPGKLTAATGMDALTHAIEAYVDREWSPASDALALHAMRLLSGSILRACAHPDDLESRGAMAVGSFLAGVAFSHSMVGMTHGISHALGGVYHIPHGLANALVLPEVMEYNRQACDDRYADVALAIGVQFPQAVAQGQSLLAAGGIPRVSALIGKVPPLAGWVGAKAHRARRIASDTMGTLGFIDDWFRRQAAKAAISRIRTLNRQLSHLTGMPLNLRDAGIDDDLTRLPQVVSRAMEDGAMLYNPVTPRSEAVEEIVKRLYYQRPRPLPVSETDLTPPGAARRDAALSGVFSDSEAVFDVLGGFYLELKNDPSIGPALTESGLVVQFVYRNPDAVITIDASGDEPEIHMGTFAGDPEVTMTMDADFAHRFWHGRTNLLTALTRREVVAKGNVARSMRLLPILKPAYEKYPIYLRHKGLDSIVLA